MLTAKRFQAVAPTSPGLFRVRCETPRAARERYGAAGDPDEAGAAVADGPGEEVPTGMADSDGKADGDAEEAGAADGEEVGGS